MRIAIIQKAPVFLHREQTIALAVQSLHDAADRGAALVVFPEAFISGYPAIPNRDWLKASAIFRKLPELRKTIGDLEARIAELEAKLEACQAGK